MPTGGPPPLVDLLLEAGAPPECWRHEVLCDGVDPFGPWFVGFQGGWQGDGGQRDQDGDGDGSPLIGERPWSDHDPDGIELPVVARVEGEGYGEATDGPQEGWLLARGGGASVGAGDGWQRKDGCGHS